MKIVKVAGACLAVATAYPVLAAAEVKKAPDQEIVTLQVQLDRQGFAPGVIDGQQGASLKKAVTGFQKAHDLPETGEADDATKQALSQAGAVPGLIEVTLQQQDFAGPFVGPIPKSEMAQARLPSLGYSNVLESLAERYHTTSAALVSFNGPGTPLKAGTRIRVPNVIPPATSYPDKLRPDWKATLASLSVSSDQPQAAKIVVSKHEGVLRVYDDGGKLVAQFPATMGSQHDPLPIGHWKIQGTSYLPAFHYNPKLFWDAKSGDKKTVLKSGPNGPVGVVWMDLNKAHYGIHGTPNPEKIGRTESHGCIRLANWDAARLSLMVKPGTPADFEE